MSAVQSSLKKKKGIFKNMNILCLVAEKVFHKTKAIKTECKKIHKINSNVTA